MATGNAARTVAATNMNATSSRSHAVFQIFIKQKVFKFFRRTLLSIIFCKKKVLDMSQN